MRNSSISVYVTTEDMSSYRNASEMGVGHRKNRCNVLKFNQRHFILMEPGDLWTIGSNALKNEVIR